MLGMWHGGLSIIGFQWSANQLWGLDFKDCGGIDALNSFPALFGRKSV